MDHPTRPLKSDERRLLMLLLLSRRDGVRLTAEVDEIRVQEMADGGMGSLRFERDGNNRRRSRTFASAQFKDVDEVRVLVSLELDQNGGLFELDVWKVDFSPLRQIPDNSHISVE